MLTWIKRLSALLLMTMVLSAPTEAYSEPSAIPQVSRPTLHIGLDYLLSQEIDNAGLRDTQVNSLGFRIGGFYRMATTDIGILIGHYGFGTFFNEADGKSRSSVAQSFAVGALRWRFSNSTLGSYFLGVRIGLSAFALSNESLDEAKTQLADRPTPTGLGFHVGSDLGVLLHMSEHAVSILKFGFTIGGMPFETDFGQEVMSVTTLFISYGIEFIM
jgi:hypothetical protein